jgi:mRNA interferase MazF
MALRGEVFWVRFDEPVGRRPVLIVQNNRGNQSSPNTIVAHISTRPPGREYPFLVALDDGHLGEPSWVHCETINTIPQTKLDERLGALGPAEMEKVNEALRRSLGLPQ